MIWKPLNFLRVRHAAKVWPDFIWPTLAAAAYLIVACGLQIKVPFVGTAGVLSQVNSLLGVLSGFYIASLAAIATLSNATLDEKMKGKPPTLEIVTSGETYTKKLTRREYLLMLFGYLALLSIILFFVGIGINLLYPAISAKIGAEQPLLSLVATILRVGYVFILTNLMLNTLIGVYYLSDRMHRDVAVSKDDSKGSPTDEEGKVPGGAEEIFGE